jgi:hypothetical protein
MAQGHNTLNCISFRSSVTLAPHLLKRCGDQLDETISEKGKPIERLGRKTSGLTPEIFRTG